MSIDVSIHPSVGSTFKEPNVSVLQEQKILQQDDQGKKKGYERTPGVVHV